jgi:hypothetical protein
MSQPAAAPALGPWGSALLGVLRRVGPSGLEIGLGVEPGLVKARVRPGRGSAHRLRIRFMDLGPEAWHRVIASLVAEPSLLGTLLDGELPPAVVEAAGGRQAIVPLRGELMVTCSCGARADRCLFLGAAWRDLAEAVDLAPATLLTLRGRSPEQLVAAVRCRAAQRDRGQDDGIDAAVAYQSEPRPLPCLPPLPSETAGHPGWRWTPRDRPPLPDALGLLVADAAARARDVRSGGGDGSLQLSEEMDLARRAARLERDPSLLLMAQRAGMTLDMLTEMGRTWHRGGAAAVEVLYGEWSPPPEALAPARKLLAAHGRVTVRRNQVGLDRRHLELRLGRDGLWYLVDVSSGGASLVYQPAEDPALLVAARLGFVPRTLEAPRPAAPAGEQLTLL